MALSKPEYIQISCITVLYKGSSKVSALFPQTMFIFLNYILTYSMEQSPS